MTKILVIEDEESIRDSIVEILEMQCFDTAVADNGREGLHLAKEHLPDLILCDIEMPELDGRDVLSALRKDLKTATIPFIFLTARNDRVDIRQGMGLGADDYLSKPFTTD